MVPVILRHQPIAGPLLVYLAVALLLLASGWALRIAYLRRRRRTLQASYDAAMLATGTPDLKAVNDSARDQDTLGYGAVADAIAGLLRNKATSAPYSVVVSGSWGSGKSSVMLQVKKKLTEPAMQNAFIPIPINVWHYQSGQHLLGGFLRRLFVACDTAPYRRSFRWFQLRELGFRNSLKVTLAVSLLLPVALYLGWLLVEPVFKTMGWADGVHAAVRQLGQFRLFSLPVGTALLAPFHLLDMAPDLLKGTPPSSSSETTSPGLLLGGAALAWLGTLVAGLRAFYSYGDVVKELVPLQQFDQEIKVDAGFRDDFRKQLLDVLQHAPPATRIVFFVDDVDRIPGSRVQELLESLSFLVEACREARDVNKEDPDQGARLYFVMGMYVPEVVRTLADALAPPPVSRPEAHRYAARYLDKMVDLVVPMPTLAQSTPGQITNLLFGDEAPAQP